MADEELTIGMSGNSAVRNSVGVAYNASLYAGWTGYSGMSGWSGWTGLPGISGYSGQSGESGPSGLSGWSGWSGWSGLSGESGVSGWSGYPVFDYPRDDLGYAGGDVRTVYSTEVPQFVRLLIANPGADMSIFRSPTSWRSRLTTHTGVGVITFPMDYEVFTRGYRTLLDRGFIHTSGDSAVCEYWNGTIRYCSNFVLPGFSLVNAHLSTDWTSRTMKYFIPIYAGSYYSRCVRAYGL